MTQVFNAATSLLEATEKYQNHGSQETIVQKATRHFVGRWDMAVVGLKGAAQLVYNLFASVIDGLRSLINKAKRSDFTAELYDAKEGGKISFIGVVGAVVCPAAAIWLMNKLAKKAVEVTPVAAPAQAAVSTPVVAAPAVDTASAASGSVVAAATAPVVQPVRLAVAGLKV